MEDGFEEGDEFSDVDIAIVDGTGGFKGVDEFDGVDLGGGPVHEFERNQVLPVEGAAVEAGQL